MKKTLLLGIPFLFLTPLSLFALSDLTLATNAHLSKESLILVEASSTVEASSSASTLTECSQQAIEDRDTAIANSRTLYNNAMTKALTERKNREKAAIAMKTEEERKIAIKASVENYKNQAKAAQNALTQARKLAWQTFENDIGKCRKLGDLTTSLDKDTAKEDTPLASFKKMEETETKSIKGSIKAQFESFKSLFNKD